MHRLFLFWLTLFGALAHADSLPPEDRIFQNETSLGLILGPDVAENSFVAAHCEALQRYLQQIIMMPELPPPAARIEVIATDSSSPLTVLNKGGVVVAQIQIQSASQASSQLAEAVSRLWLGRAAVAAGKPVDVSQPWLRQALKSETLAMLRPAMVDAWYRQGRATAPARLRDVVEGRAPDFEAFLFWRALRAELGGASEQVRVMIAVSRGEDVLREARPTKPWDEEAWLLARANLLLTRMPPSLSMQESADALRDISRFVFDFGKGDTVWDGPALVHYREAKGVKVAMAARWSALQREILRQNPVYHNTWRALGSWLENFETATPEELNELWGNYLRERAAAETLQREVKQVLVDSNHL